MRDDCTEVKFSIRPDGGGWRWATFDSEGGARAKGRAATQAIAAALVIRDICRAQGAQPAKV
jgi:hypothetical protein